jgi:predicted nucleotidyltransferase component of viral defense system
MPVGPVLHIDDLVATKVTALATRAYPRDFVDVAGLLQHYDRERLVALGRTVDPGLDDDEVAAAMRRLDRLDDSVFALYGLGPEKVAEVRSRFTDWPRH